MANRTLVPDIPVECHNWLTTKDTITFTPTVEEKMCPHAFWTHFYLQVHINHKCHNEQIAFNVAHIWKKIMGWKFNASMGIKTLVSGIPGECHSI